MTALWSRSWCGDEREQPYRFVSLMQLLHDVERDVVNWR
jgi:hypothetical protein